MLRMNWIQSKGRRQTLRRSCRVSSIRSGMARRASGRSWTKHVLRRMSESESSSHSNVHARPDTERSPRPLAISMRYACSMRLVKSLREVVRPSVLGMFCYRRGERSLIFRSQYLLFLEHHRATRNLGVLQQATLHRWREMLEWPNAECLGTW